VDWPPDSMTNYQTAIEFALKWEGALRPDGGYTNDKTDRGGETKYGISDNRDGVTDGRSEGNTPIKELSFAEAMSIYKRDYWDANGLDSEPSPLCIVLFDMYVNMNRKTVTRLRSESYRDWKRLIQLRKDHYGRICMKDPSQQKYLKGWLNRTNDLHKLCQILEQNQQ